MKSLKYIISVFIFSMLIFSCNMTEDVKEVQDVEIQLEDIDESNDLATIAIDNASIEMSVEERQKYYSSMGKEKVMDLFSRHFDISEERCRLSQIRCNDWWCGYQWSNYYPDRWILTRSETGCVTTWHLCVYDWDCH